MQLHYHRSGQGRPLFILHGLFGSWENLGGAIKQLSERWDVIAPDLRNHGRSAHNEDCGYPALAADILELADQLEIAKFAILGHSMGGKVAMELALTHPDRIEQLIVVDIAPVQYPNHHSDTFAGLRAVDLHNIKSRNDADQAMAQHINEPSVRLFLLKNLARTPSKGFEWRVNLDALEAHYEQISAGIREGVYDGPVLFIKGANSNYLKPEYQKDVLTRFPRVKLKVIDQAGHWPHAEKPQLFNRLVESFLGESA